MKEIKPGFYKHFKGGIYEVIGVAKNSEDPTQKLVIYYDSNKQLWARPIEMFLENIERDNYGGPRFQPTK